ncbi:MAG TPA: tetratricopeptide repeat protein, partial [Pyrinomonadaceae bacterium]|nr:tetratricopeptide repeat protein [Pyrinomonadaceae bacterium]
AFQVRVLTHGTNYMSQTRRVEVVRPLGFGAISEQVEFVLTSRETTTTATRGVLFVQEVPAPARKEFERGAALIKKPEQQKAALASLNKALEIFPQYYDALELLGTEYVKQQQYEPAVPLLTKAVEINPRGQASWYALGVAQYNLKQSPAALEALRRSVSLSPRSINSHLWLGIVLRLSGKLDEAETSLRAADKLADSKLPDPHWQLALLLNQMKRYKEAADQLELFLKVEPNARDTELIKKLIKRLREQG